MLLPVAKHNGQIFLLFAVVCSACSSARAVEPIRVWQPTPARPFVVRGSERRLLDRAEQYLADRQWDDAVAALMRLVEEDSGRVVAVDDRLYISLSEHCQRLLAKLPDDALARYRQLVDATAAAWLRDGTAGRDAELLQRVADNYFVSSWGDDALYALGELALERGDYQSARSAWMRLQSYPDSDLSVAAIEARLALVAIREGDFLGAEKRLEQLRSQHPDARGRLGGREVVLADHLERLLKQAQRWPSALALDHWTTFAANPARTNTSAASKEVAPYELVWSVPIGNEPLTVFPVVVDDLVIFQDATSVRAFQLSDGSEAFVASGETFQSPDEVAVSFGRPIHTLTAADGFVYGVTTTSLGANRRAASSDRASVLWGIDPQRDGALALQITSDDPRIAFVGAPVIAAGRAYVPVRSNVQMARSGVACYDLDTQLLVWQRWLCQANTPAAGFPSEFATNLLAFDGSMLYANTNLGGIAAVRASDGRVEWLRTYDRQGAVFKSAEECEYYRGPNPGICYRNLVFSIPTDGSELLAIDATDGRQLWTKSVSGLNARLVGICQDSLVLFDSGIEFINPGTGDPIDNNAATDARERLLPNALGYDDELRGFAATEEYAVVADQIQLMVYRQKIQSTGQSQVSQSTLKE